MMRKLEVERFSLTSSKPFDQVAAALSAAIGHPDMAEFWESTFGPRLSQSWKAQSRKPWGRQG